MSKKLSQMVLHISEISKDDPAFGLTKLNKILFTADFLAYCAWGKPITESNYIHLDNGPAPKEMKPTLEKLKTSGHATVETRDYFGHTQKRIVPQIGSDTSKFTKEELKLIKDVIDVFKDAHGSGLSDWSHTLVPWIYTKNREKIPYFTTYTMFHVPVTRDGILWAEQELEQLKQEGNVG